VILSGLFVSNLIGSCWHCSLGNNFY